MTPDSGPEPASPLEHDDRLRFHTELEQAVQHALATDPRVKRPEAIAVFADGIGSVTLRGTVETLVDRHAAMAAARRVEGMLNLIDELQIRFFASPDEYSLRGRLLQLLIDDPALHVERLDLAVSGHQVTLSGQVESVAAASRAFELVASQPEVGAVTSRIIVRQQEPRHLP